MMKLFAQLLAVLSATPLPRSEDGKISAGMAHGLDRLAKELRYEGRQKFTRDSSWRRSIACMLVEERR